MMKMSERKIIAATAALGVVVLLLLFKVWTPFVWNLPPDAKNPQATVAAITGGAVSEAENSGDDLPKDANETEEPVIASEAGTTILTRIALPDGYERKTEEKTAFSSYVRNYPLKKTGSKIKQFNGENATNQENHEAVFKLPLEKENLQQGAGTVVRMYAEYLWKMEMYDKICFNFASGFEAEYAKWQDGYRILTNTSGVYWSSTKKEKDVSYKEFKNYLRMVFAYTSTSSLYKETKETTLEELQIGDLLINKNSPKSVAMVVDICENSEGKKAFLLAKGGSPACQFHIIKNPAHEDTAWYFEEEIKYPFETAEYTFAEESFRHPVYLDALN